MNMKSLLVRSANLSLYARLLLWLLVLPLGITFKPAPADAASTDYTMTAYDNQNARVTGDSTTSPAFTITSIKIKRKNLATVTLTSSITVTAVGVGVTPTSITPTSPSVVVVAMGDGDLQFSYDAATYGEGIITFQFVKSGTTFAEAGIKSVPVVKDSDLIATNLDAAVSTRQASGSAVTLPVGTGAGQINLSGGGVALQSGQIVASVSGSVGSVSGNVGGNVSGSVGSVSGDIGGKILGGGSSAFVGNGVQVDKSGYSLLTAPPTAAAIRTEMDNNSTRFSSIVALLGTPANGSIAADIGVDHTSLSTLLTRVPNTLPVFPSNFSLLDINGSGLVTATNGGGGGSSGLSNQDIAAIWAYIVPNSPTAGSVMELVKTRLDVALSTRLATSALTFDNSGNVMANTQVMSSSAMTALSDAIGAAQKKGISRDNAILLAASTVAGSYHMDDIDTIAHTQVTRYYVPGTTKAAMANNTGVLVGTSTVTFKADNKSVTDRAYVPAP